MKKKISHQLILPFDSQGDSEETQAVLYARTATVENSSSNSSDCEAQLQELRDFVLGQGYQIRAELYDEGYSGATLCRPSLHVLREIVRAGGVDVVCVVGYDRISRSSDLHIIEQEFNASNAVLKTCRERADLQ